MTRRPSLVLNRHFHFQFGSQFRLNSEVWLMDFSARRRRTHGNRQLYDGSFGSGRLLTFVGILLLQLPAASECVAPKLSTYVYLAEVAMYDATEDGKVTIYRVDYERGQILKDASGNPVEVGRYEVDPRILESLRTAPAHFRAGVIGPDGYPDLLTGQQIIHPAGRRTPGESEVDLNNGGPGPNPWLQYLWDVAFESDNAEDTTPQARAFVIGYLTHAAGDMYAHSFVNYFAGGAFHFHPHPENAIKHIVLEGYVAKKTPSPTFEASIDGIEPFITRHMVFGLPGSHLLDTLLTGSNSKFSVPAIYSRKYAWLTRDIDEFEKKQQEYNEKIDRAIRRFNYGLAGWLGLQKAGHRLENGPRIDYYKRWRDDIRDRIAKWPRVSHDVAMALVFKSDRTTDFGAAKDVLNEYAIEHLLSMAGGPDVVGEFLAFVGEWKDRLLRAIGIPQLEEILAEMERNFYDYMLTKALGISLTELEEYLKDPENQFDPVLNNPVWRLGHRISRATFDEQELRLDGAEYFDYRRRTVGYNRATMTKVLLMSKSEVDRLMADLGSSDRMDHANAMLGFIETLDGSAQWKANAAKMIVARDDNAYRQIFMEQTGEDGEIGQPPPRLSIQARYAVGPTGCRIVHIASGGSAELAGLRVGDIITAVDGKPVGAADFTTDYFSQRLYEVQEGRIAVEFLRNGTTETAAVTVSQSP